MVGVEGWGEAHVTFDQDGQPAHAYGSPGVNRFTASFEVDGRRITFGPAATTMMAGPDELMAQEFAFLRALENATAYTVNGDHLELFGGPTLLARFEASGAEPTSHAAP